MFSADGSLLLGVDKSTILHQIEGLITLNEDDTLQLNDSSKVVIYDGMALVNQLKKDSDIKNMPRFS